MPPRQPKVVRSFWRNPSLRLALYVLIAAVASFIQEAGSIADPDEITGWKWLLISFSVVLQSLNAFRAFIDQSISDIEKENA